MYTEDPGESMNLTDIVVPAFLKLLPFSWEADDNKVYNCSNQEVVPKSRWCSETL